MAPAIPAVGLFAKGFGRVFVPRLINHFMEVRYRNPISVEDLDARQLGLTGPVYLDIADINPGQGWGYRLDGVLGNAKTRQTRMLFQMVLVDGDIVPVRPQACHHNQN